MIGKMASLYAVLNFIVSHMAYHLHHVNVYTCLGMSLVYHSSHVEQKTHAVSILCTKQSDEGSICIRNIHVHYIS